jgi:very-short-patch-repair endonuclease
MDPSDVPFEAVNQRGTFTRQQAYEEGWTARQVRRRLDSGRWKVVAGSALAARRCEVGPWQLAFAVVLTWPGAVISHQLAGALHGFPVNPSGIGTATVPHARALRARGLLAHRVPLRPDETGVIGRLPVTSELRTAADLLAHLPWDDARSLLAWLVTRRRVTVNDLDVAAARRPRQVGTAQLRRLIAASRTGALSAAEDRLHRLLRAADIRGWRANAPVVVSGRVVAVVDVLFATARVVIEVDGYGSHSSREAFQRDRSRQNDLVAAGYVVLRFTWADIERRPQQVVDRIRAAVARAA